MQYPFFIAFFGMVIIPKLERTVILHIRASAILGCLSPHSFHFCTKVRQHSKATHTFAHNTVVDLRSWPPVSANNLHRIHHTTLFLDHAKNCARCIDSTTSRIIRYGGRTDGKPLVPRFSMNEPIRIDSGSSRKDLRPTPIHHSSLLL